MFYVHSLVKVQIDNKTGWLAPIEMEDDTSHYISYVIPINQRYDSAYKCDIIRITDGKQVVEGSLLVKQRTDTFLLSVEKMKVWFAVRPIAKSSRRIPYIGKIKHPDFAHFLTEIEPEDPTQIDELFIKHGIGVVGCDPVTHYLGYQEQNTKHH